MTWWIRFELTILHICIYFYKLTATAYNFLSRYYDICTDLINITCVKTIKCIYLALANGKRILYVSRKFSPYIHNQWRDKVIISTFSEIIYNLFMTSFAYIVC